MSGVEENTKAVAVPVSDGSIAAVKVTGTNAEGNPVDETIQLRNGQGSSKARFKSAPAISVEGTVKGRTVRVRPARLFQVGMRVTVHGVPFEVRKLTDKDVVLRSVPMPVMDGHKDGSK